MIRQCYRPQIIALCGPKRSGKDTVAKYLVDRDPNAFVHAKIASGLKDTIRILFELTPEQLEESKDIMDPRWGVRPRQLMQFLGTDVMQFEIQNLMPHMGRRFWIKQLLTRNPLHPNKCLVISDMRFLHEAEEIRHMDPHACLIRVVNPRVQGGKDTQHLSEQEYKHIAVDHVVHNDGCMASLYTKIDETLKTRIQ